MKYSIRLLLILATLLPSQACLAIGFAEQHPKSIIQFTNSLCKSIGQDPVITVCVSGEPGEGEFNEHTLKALKSKTKTLVHDYKKNNRTVNAKFTTTTCGSQCTPTDWDPATCGGTSYCAMHAADPACMPPPPPPPGPCDGPMGMMTPGCPGYVPPPDPCAGTAGTTNPSCPNYDICLGPMGTMTPGCPGYIPPSACNQTDWNPTTCGSPTYCSSPAHSMEPACIPNPCTGGGTAASCNTFCTAHAADPYCMMHPPTSCSYADWIPAVCDTSGMNKEYCEVYPSDTVNCH